MPLALILDMDGLMLDTEPVSLRAWRNAASAFGLTLENEVYGQMIGLNLDTSKELLERLFGPSCPVDELAQAAYVRYREDLAANGVPIKAGLFEFLQFLEEHRIPRAVATSTATDLARHKLGCAGVLSHFDVVVGGDQVARGKPAPDIFLLAAERLGFRPADCAVLEDSDPGIRAANAAGMRSILIPDDGEPRQETREAAFAVVPSLGAARVVIERLLG
jgi:HAD superfamily hydrolase (TIGR01509 family)